MNDFSLGLPRGSPPELMTAIEDAIRGVLKRHGFSAFMMPRNAALAHETGHAIVAAHEGFGVRSVTVFSRAVSGTEYWGGYCMDNVGPWHSGPDSTIDDDLRRARFIVAGLAGEAITGQDLPGSSLDELALSQLIGLNAAVKLDNFDRSDAEYNSFAQKLWHDQVWNVVISILRANREPFLKIVHHLDQKQRMHGARLRQALDQVRSIAS